jgi:hypothetical protein
MTTKSAASLPQSIPSISQSSTDSHAPSSGSISFVTSRSTNLAGFYFDLDVFLSESLSPLLEHSCVFPFEELTFNDICCRYGFDWRSATTLSARLPSPFLGAVIENCVRGQRDPSGQTR